MNTTIFQKGTRNMQGEKWSLPMTLVSWPVIIDSTRTKVLLHIAKSTGKYQFIGWKLEDTFSLQENALKKAMEVVWNNVIKLLEYEPIIIKDIIEREWKPEEIILFHYLASIENESDIWEAKWFNLDQIEKLDQNKETSSPNVLICSSHFLNTLNK